MKITKKQLKKMVRRERRNILRENFVGFAPGSGVSPMKSIADPRLAAELKRQRLQEQPELESVDNNTHHWPRVDWTNVGELTDKWADGEEDAFDPGDPSMRGGDDASLSDAKSYWKDQVENAAMDLEAELTQRVRKIALQTMKEFTDKLINGDYS
jgi:hypothetical protein